MSDDGLSSSIHGLNKLQSLLITFTRLDQRLGASD